MAIQRFRFGEREAIQEAYGDIVNNGYSAMTMGSPFAYRPYKPGTDELKSAKRQNGEQMRNAIGGAAGLALAADAVNGFPVSRAVGGKLAGAAKGIAKYPLKHPVKTATFPIRHPLSVIGADLATGAHGTDYLLDKAKDTTIRKLDMEVPEEKKFDWRHPFASVGDKVDHYGSRASNAATKKGVEMAVDGIKKMTHAVGDKIGDGVKWGAEKLVGMAVGDDEVDESVRFSSSQRRMWPTMQNMHEAESINSNPYGVSSAIKCDEWLLPKDESELNHKKKAYGWRYVRLHPDAIMYETPDMVERRRAKEAIKKVAKEEDNRILTEKRKLDALYFDALKRNDMDTAAKIIEKAAEISGYSSSNDWRMTHQAPNSTKYEDGSGDECLADIVLDEHDNVIKSTHGSIPEDYFTNFNAYYQMDGDFEAKNLILNAIRMENRIKQKYGDSPHRHATLKIYRGVDGSSNTHEGSMRNGDWVTPLYLYAKANAEDPSNSKPRIITMTVPINHLWWNCDEIQELGYDDGRRYAYRDVKNNRKSLDVIIKDESGKIIPPSRRFNHHKESTDY